MNTKSLYVASSLCLCCTISWAMEPNPLKEEISSQVNPAQLGDFNTLKELCLPHIPPSQILALKEELGTDINLGNYNTISTLPEEYVKQHQNEIIELILDSKHARDFMEYIINMEDLTTSHSLILQLRSQLPDTTDGEKMRIEIDQIILKEFPHEQILELVEEIVKQKQHVTYNFISKYVDLKYPHDDFKRTYIKLMILANN